MIESTLDTRLLHEIESIKNYLVAAQEVVKSGHMPQLAGLEKRIAVLCEAILESDSGMRQSYLPELHKIIEHLNACETMMRENAPPKSS